MHVLIKVVTCTCYLNSVAQFAQVAFIFYIDQQARQF
jgi:hypothetical protein